MPYIIPGGTNRGSTNISAVSLDQYGHLIFTMEDGTVVDAGRLFTDAQIENINSAFSPSELGAGLSVDNEGKLNVSATITVGGQAITIANNTFTIPQATSSTAGFVKLSNEFDVNNDGQVILDEVNVNKLVVDQDTELIIGG